MDQISRQAFLRTVGEAIQSFVQELLPVCGAAREESAQGRVPLVEESARLRKRRAER